MINNFVTTKIVTTKDAVGIMKQHGVIRSQRHVAWLCEKGELKGACKMGQTWVIPKDELLVYVATQPRNKRIRVKRRSCSNDIA